MFSLTYSIQSQSKDFKRFPLVNTLILERVQAKGAWYMDISTKDKPDSLWQLWPFSPHNPQPHTRPDQSLVTSVRVWEAHCSCGIWCYFYRERGPPTLFHNENKGTGGDPWIKDGHVLMGENFWELHVSVWWRKGDRKGFSNLMAWGAVIKPLLKFRNCQVSSQALKSSSFERPRGL